MKGQILIIDDNPVDVKIAISSIERIGFACYGFTDHHGAILWLESNVPQLILLDLQMPTITGYELIPILKKNANAAGVPIIIISGKNQSEDVLRAIKLGANDYVVKPLDPLVLQEKVEKVNAGVDSEFHSVDITEADGIKAFVSKAIKILSLSEFGMKVSSETKLSPGETLEVTGLPLKEFGTDRLLVRCLSCEAATTQLYVAQMTFVGMIESQRQALRQTCRKIWIQTRNEAT